MHTNKTGAVCTRPRGKGSKLLQRPGLCVPQRGGNPPSSAQALLTLLHRRTAGPPTEELPVTFPGGLLTDWERAPVFHAWERHCRERPYKCFAHIQIRRKKWTDTHTQPNRVSERFDQIGFPPTKRAACFRTASPTQCVVTWVDFSYWD